MNNHLPTAPLAALVITATLLSSFDTASAGRQPNPLPVYALDNTRYELHYEPDGIRLRDQLYVPAGRNRFRMVADPVDDCPNGEPGRVVGELIQKRRGFVWKLTEYLGCGEGRLAVFSRTERWLSREAAPEDEVCVRRDYVYEQRGQTLILNDRCDGTLGLRATSAQLADSPQITISEVRSGRWDGQQIVMSHPPATWRAKLTWKRSRPDRLRGVSVRVRVDAWDGSRARTIRLRGTWTRVPPPAGAAP